MLRKQPVLQLWLEALTYRNLVVLRRGQEFKRGFRRMVVAEALAVSVKSQILFDYAKLTIFSHLKPQCVQYLPSVAFITMESHLLTFSKLSPISHSQTYHYLGP